MKGLYKPSYLQKKAYDFKKVFIGIFILCIIIFMVVMNWTRLNLLVKGYDFSSQNIILSLSKDEREDYLHGDVIDFSKWDHIQNQEHYYDYELYQKSHQNESIEEVITYVDYLYKHQGQLETLGYQREDRRKLMIKLSLDDFKSIIDHQYFYQDIIQYINVNGCVIDDIDQYIASKKQPLDAVLSVSYPFIDSQNKINRTYQIVQPDHYLVLIKKGFMIHEEDEPKDLVKVAIPNAPDNESDLLRKDAADALKNMYDDALKEDMHLVLNSGYRSYQQQKDIYDEYFRIYDEVTASGLVAEPGVSEHQLGLGVDLTSQSVLDGERMVFGDTKEYQWVKKNAHRYGFILRYPPERSKLTGTTNEPWHLRYVGKDAAKEIYEKDWVLEDYILHYGFSYLLKEKE